MGIPPYDIKSQNKIIISYSAPKCRKVKIDCDKTIKKMKINALLEHHIQKDLH